MSAALPPCQLLVSDLKFARGEQVIIDGIGFRLRPGEALRVEGPNGAGKSTLLRLLAGLLTPDGGKIELTGDIGWLGHADGFDDRRTLAEEMRFWLGGIPDRDIVDFGVSQLVEIPIRLLSQGQKRRAALWRLAAENAPIWLLDEPGAGLDRAGREALGGAIHAHCEAGGIAVVATHGETVVSAGATLDLGVPA